MKMAVYLAGEMELLGVVDVDRDMAERMRNGGYWNCAKCPPIRAAYTRDTVPTSDTFEVIAFQFVPLHGSRGQTCFIKVLEREHLACWPRQLWPRRREKPHKLPKADRRARAQAQGNQYRLRDPNQFRR